MTVWRPAPGIRLKALGLLWRGDRLLVAEVRDDGGALTGLRPLGGTVEFGETATAAVIREWHEELGLAVTPMGPPHWIENIFTHAGRTGHEIVAVFDLAPDAGQPLGPGPIAFTEDGGTPCIAVWCDIATLDAPDGPQLFPAGLKPHLLSRRAGA